MLSIFLFSRWNQISTLFYCYYSIKDNILSLQPLCPVADHLLKFFIFTYTFNRSYTLLTHVFGLCLDSSATILPLYYIFLWNYRVLLCVLVVLFYIYLIRLNFSYYLPWFRCFLLFSSFSSLSTSDRHYRSLQLLYLLHF